MSAANEACIVAGVRTPIGRFGGALSALQPDDLAAHVLRAVVERAGVPPSDVEDVVLGCANQAGEDNRDVARMAALLADFPETVAGVTVNRLCGSGMEAVATAARAIALGEADVHVAGRGIHEPRAMGGAKAGLRVPDRPLHDARHELGLAAGQPAAGMAGAHRSARADGRGPDGGALARTGEGG